MITLSRGSIATHVRFGGSSNVNFYCIFTAEYRPTGEKFFFENWLIIDGVTAVSLEHATVGCKLSGGGLQRSYRLHLRQ